MKVIIMFLNDPRNINLGKKLITDKKILIEKERFKEINETKYHEILINHTTPYSPFDILENKSLNNLEIKLLGNHLNNNLGGDICQYLVLALKVVPYSSASLISKLFDLPSSECQ